MTEMTWDDWDEKRCLEMTRDDFGLLGITGMKRNEWDEWDDYEDKR